MSCSVVYDNGLVGRNYDWLYSEMASCVYSNKGIVGVAGGLEAFTNSFAKSKVLDWSVYSKLRDFLVDGVNEYGLHCSTLVTPNIVNKSRPINKFKSVNSVYLVNYVLSNFETAQAAIEDLRDFTEIVFPPFLLEMGYNQHWLIADSNKCYLFEVNESGNSAIIDYTGKKCVVTNFHHYDVVFNGDGTVCTPASADKGDPVETNHIKPYGSGLERYNKLYQTQTNNLEEMKLALESVKYTNIYVEANGFYTDFVSKKDNLKCNSPIKDFTPVIRDAEAKFPQRSRKKGEGIFGFWNTNHSSIYDLKHSEMYVCGQENFDNWCEVGLKF